MERKFRLSNVLSTTIPEPLDAQLRDYCATSGYRRSSVIRAALTHALRVHHVFTPSGAPTFTKPTPIRASLLTQCRLLTLTSNHRQIPLSCDLLPAKNPTLRDGIDRYTQAHELTVSLFTTYALALFLKKQTTTNESDDEPDTQPKT